jgi:Glycosyltransferase family 87
MDRDSRIILILLTGYVLCFVVFFVFSTFFSDSFMKFIKYIPRLNPVGADLHNILQYCRIWWIHGVSPYADATLYYPPLAIILFLPLIFCSYKTAYCIVSVLTLLCFILSVAVFPPLISKKRDSISPYTVFFVLTGLTSYGLIFELERGQWNVIAMTCGVAACYFFLQGKRWAAYGLLSLGITLKVYPLIYIIFLLDTGATWKKNILRILCFGIINAALLFVLGWNMFADFFALISENVELPYVWVGNHSLRAFSMLIGKVAPQFQFLALFAMSIMVIVTLAAILLLVTLAWRSGDNHKWLALLSVSTIGACLIPSVSHDYKLSLVPFAVSLFFHSVSAVNRAVTTFADWSCVCIISGMYGLMLFSYAYKPLWLGQNTIPLFAMLVTMTYLSIGQSESIATRLGNSGHHNRLL